MKGRPYRKDENQKFDSKYRSKLTLDDTRRESEENADLLRALKYLKNMVIKKVKMTNPGLGLALALGLGLGQDHKTDSEWSNMNVVIEKILMVRQEFALTLKRKVLV